MATKPREGSELFYVDANGRRRDAKFHEQILGRKFDPAAKARGYLPEKPVNPPTPPAKADE
jgi:hypothetical protein